MKKYFLITSILLASLLTSCSPRIVEHLVVQRDTTYVSTHTRDSIYLHDSVYVKEFIKGDTVKITEYRERWRERIKEVHDTSYILKVDSVQVAVPVEVEKKLSPVKKFKLWAFFPLILIALVGWRKEIYKLIRMII